MTSTKSEYFRKMRQEHVAQGPAHITQAVIQKASGAVMTDVDGKEFIDFAGGIGVNNVGHSHPKVVKAIKDQADQFIHTCFHVGMYDSYIELAARLNDLAPGDFAKKTMFGNSGAEAVENAVKVARYATKRPAVIAFENGFHGRTLLTMSLTSKIMPYKYGFGPFAPEIYRIPYPYCYRCPLGCKYPDCNIACAEYLESYFITYVDPDSVAAIIAEPIQGEGGFVTPPPEYFPKLAEICKKHGILLIIDEVQSGAGRTGKFLAIEHWGIEPDIITQAKSLAGGMPLSAITGRQELMDAPHPGGLGGTYSGNPLSCKAALAVLDILFEDKLLERSKELGEILFQRFSELQNSFEIIGDVRGKGPMLALELVKDRQTREPAAAEAKKLTQLCYEKGLVLLSCGNFGNVIRTLMPFVITDEQLDKGLSIMEESLRELTK
ncbi:MULTISPECIES: 4-aminobutyrate--2-oxoglutarate transaminase [Desulfobacula]|uniref:GabT: 4-aminobutyrate aminotransferase (Gamma-amino-N-butyrate transaminase) n=2 Tax=Desulfobacula TaxID=28222 RepID=K0N2C7_DESTT|nr:MULTISPECIES: 4-aminobutyrate--2-oxoglutarate transaminase [Desulfobacula]CCK78299.1 GabT: 4-aminobutyrate aminotransferase (Gamma-amino-N-butyrate transaminase) [Desulfobacula toluolica Tol2]SDU57581.1 4-aminobutyrate aminotransferase / (S)-3-amino-2-methylpropionate transaminase [Desulfobacula phenolica]